MVLLLFLSLASKLWEAIPFELKKLSYTHFYKQYRKRYLLKLFLNYNLFDQPINYLLHVLLFPKR